MKLSFPFPFVFRHVDSSINSTFILREISFETPDSIDLISDGIHRSNEIFFAMY